MTEDETVGRHHRLNGHEFEQTLGDNEGQGSLACCSPWGCKGSDRTELNWTSVKRGSVEKEPLRIRYTKPIRKIPYFSLSVGIYHSLVEVMEFQLNYSKSWKMMLWKCCTQYASKFGKLSSGHRTGKGQFAFQSQRKAMSKNAQTTAQLHSSHMLVK